MLSRAGAVVFVFSFLDLIPHHSTAESHNSFYFYNQKTAANKGYNNTSVNYWLSSCLPSEKGSADKGEDVCRYRISHFFLCSKLDIQEDIATSCVHPHDIS